MVDVKLSKIASEEIMLENILSMSVLEWEVSRVGCKIRVWVRLAKGGPSKLW